MQHIILSKELNSDTTHGLLKKSKDEKYVHDFVQKNIVMTKKDISRSFSDDTILISMIHLFDELQESMLTFGKRLSDMYAFFYPSFIHSMRSVDELIDTIGTHEKVDSMSAKALPKDREMIIRIAKTIRNIRDQKEETKGFISTLAKRIMPNTATVIGDELAGRILGLAGSLKRLAMMPSSTIQLLGAQKAVFRHVVSGAKSPKHGILFTHPFVKGASYDRRGKIARILADKISIAVRVDYFKGEFVGDTLLEEVKKYA